MVDRMNHRGVPETDRLSLAARLEHLPRFQEFIVQQAIRLGLPREQLAEVELLTDEILSNIIKYGYADQGGEIEVTRGATPEGRLYIRFSDHGTPFNPLAAADPDVTLPLTERDPGGLGIFLVKQLADRVAYEYRDNHNLLTVEIAPDKVERS